MIDSFVQAISHSPIWWCLMMLPHIHVCCRRIVQSGKRPHTESSNDSSVDTASTSKVWERFTEILYDCGATTDTDGGNFLKHWFDHKKVIRTTYSLPYLPSAFSIYPLYIYLLVFFHMPNKYRYSVILAVSFFMTWSTVPTKHGETTILAISFFGHNWPYQPNMEHQYMKLIIFTLQSTCMEILCMFVCTWSHEPPFFTTILHTWTTVLFSMLKWGSLRLTPIATAANKAFITMLLYVNSIWDIGILS